MVGRSGAAVSLRKILFIMLPNMRRSLANRTAESRELLCAAAICLLMCADRVPCVSPSSVQRCFSFCLLVLKVSSMGFIARWNDMASPYSSTAGLFSATTSLSLGSSMGLLLGMTREPICLKSITRSQVNSVVRGSGARILIRSLKYDNQVRLPRSLKPFSWGLTM